MKFRPIISAFVLALAVCVPAARGQGQQQQQPQASPLQTPIQPVAPEDSGVDADRQMPAAAARGASLGLDDTQSANTPQPDTHVVSGAEAFGVGSPINAHNLFDPAVHISVSGDTGVQSGQIDTVMSAGGTLSLDHSWNRYELTAKYAGAETLYQPDTSLNGAFHDLSVIQIIQGRRVTLRLRDDFVVSPGATFGSLSLGGPGLLNPTTLVSNLSPQFAADQSILTGTATRLSNAAVGEVDYALSRRATLTFVGSYGLLHFLAPGYVDSQNMDGRAGYSYLLDRKNSIGLTYDYNRITFGGGGGVIAGHAVQVAYGRKITGRLAFQLLGGPQLMYFQNPAIALSQQWSWNLFSSLTYQVRRTAYGLSYSHSLTNGSGVLQGALNHTVTGSVRTAFRRSWTATLNGGYSVNDTLSVDSTTLSGYGDWFGGVSFARLWGDLFRTSLSYGLQRQTTNGTACPVQNCGSTTLSQLFGITVDFHLQPIPLE